MKARFPGWYPKAPDEVGSMWESALFVPDANVLLHCLRHPATVRDKLLRLFEAMKESLWIPYQVGLEFHRNRLDVELGAQDAYDILIRDQEAIIDKAQERLRQLRAHPTISVEMELSALDMFASDFRARMEAAREQHPRSEIAAAVEKLTTLLDGKVDAKWSIERLNALKKEGEDRYAKKIPPGYKDTKKDTGEFDKYGDLIIWKSMIEKAKADKKPIIFVTDDAKEDWWWIHKGRKLGARPELIEEFRTASEQDFHIYDFGQFLRFAADRFPEIKEGVDTVERSLQDDERARRKQDEAEEAKVVQLHIGDLEDERDLIVAQLSGLPGVAPPIADRNALRVRLTQLNAAIKTLSRPTNGAPLSPGEGAEGIGDGATE